MNRPVIPDFVKRAPVSKQGLATRFRKKVATRLAKRLNLQAEWDSCYRDGDSADPLFVFSTEVLPAGSINRLGLFHREIKVVPPFSRLLMEANKATKELEEALREATDTYADPPGRMPWIPAVVLDVKGRVFAYTAGGPYFSGCNFMMLHIKSGPRFLYEIEGLLHAFLHPSLLP